MVTEHGATTTPADIVMEPANVTKGPADGFGPLKATLESIPVVYANHKVSLRSHTYIFVNQPVCRKSSPSKTG